MFWTGTEGVGVLQAGAPVAGWVLMCVALVLLWLITIVVAGSLFGGRGARRSNPETSRRSTAARQAEPPATTGSS